MIILAGIATFVAVALSFVVFVFSEGGVGYASMYAAWIIAAVLWLAVAVH